jgi:hypothetical protein
MFVGLVGKGFGGYMRMGRMEIYVDKVGISGLTG